MAHDVFVSYSVKDKTTADAICASLEANGVRVWIAPRDVMPGSDWGESIIDAILRKSDHDFGLFGQFQCLAAN